MGILDSIFGSGDQTVKQEVKYPKWYTDAAKDLIKYGNNAGKWLSKPYQGNTVAKLNKNQRQLIKQLKNNVGSTNQAYNTAMNSTRGVMNYNPTTVTARQQAYDYQPERVDAGSFLNANIDKYMNPYISTVENQALSRLNDQRLLTQSANADAAAASGAFGGSRQGIREALTDVETSRSAGELSANLRRQGYDTASNLIMQDLGRGMQADLANQQAGMANAQFGANVGLQNIANDLNAQQFNSNVGLQGAQLNLAAADQYGNQATDQQNAYMQGLQGAMTGANMQQQYRQDLLNQQMNQYNAMRNYPIEIMNTRIAALSGTQVPQTTYGNTSGGGGLASGLMGGLGGALAGASLFGTGGALAGLGGITGAGGAGIGAGLGLLAGLSDRRAKTNIEKLGKDPDSGLDIFAYDYKADVEASRKNGTPMPMKRVGPMAQDIEKRYPGSTKKVGGKMVVANLGFGG